MSCRTVGRNDVTVRLDAIPDDIPVQGNACDTGDTQFDHQVVHEILMRLHQDDVWAWATVAVSVSWNGQEATEYLGCCSYDDEEAFQQCGYFADMIDAALNQLNQDLQSLYQRLSVETNA